MPVLTGIGHERDSTVLDEVAHQRFDTPSKAVAGIQALIVKRVRESQAAFDEVAGLALKQMRLAGSNVDRLDAGIRRQAMETVTRAGAATLDSFTAVQRHAQRALHEGAQGALQAMSNVRADAGGRLATARAKAAAVAAQVASDAGAGVREARVRSGALIEEVDRVARNTVRWGKEAAEATFREVVAQGPEKTLGRGFAVVHGTTGQIVSSAAAAGKLGKLRLQFQDGSIEASVPRGKEKKP